MRKILLRANAFFAVLLLLAACAVNPVTGKKDFMLLSEQDEIRMGTEADPTIVENFGIYDDPELANFLNSVGQQMAAISHRPHLKYTFRLLDSPVVNAFALPGGYVYFTRGIMAHFNSEAECVGVLGHEIGHVTARHSAKQYSNQMLAQIGLVTGSVLSPEFAKMAGASQEAINLMFLSFSRDHESESDVLGVEYSLAIGYDPMQLANFFEALDRMDGDTGTSVVPDFYSTHPNPADRSREVQRYAARLKSEGNYPELKIGRNEFLNRLDGLVYGTDPRDGFVEDGVYYNPNFGLTFTLPSNWEVQVKRDGLISGSETGDAMLLFVQDTAWSASEAAREFVERLDVNLVKVETTEYNGMPGKFFEGDLVNPQDPSDIYYLVGYFFEHRSKVHKLIVLSERTSFKNYVDDVNLSIRNCKELTDPEKLSREPERLEVFTATQEGSAQTVLAAAGYDEERLEELLVLNGLHANEVVTAGTLLKGFK